MHLAKVPALLRLFEQPTADLLRNILGMEPLSAFFGQSVHARLRRVPIQIGCALQKSPRCFASSSSRRRISSATSSGWNLSARSSASRFTLGCVEYQYRSDAPCKSPRAASPLRAADGGSPPQHPRDGTSQRVLRPVGSR